MSELSTEFTKTKMVWLEEICSDPAISAFTFKMAFALSSFFNQVTGLAWPMHETVAKNVGATRSGVKSAIRILINAGYVGCKEAHGRNRSNQYWMAAPKNGHGGHCLFPANRRPATGKGHGHRKNSHGHDENGHGCDEKGSRASPQNTTKNTANNTSMNTGRSRDEKVNASVRERATALPTGALAREPPIEQAERKRPSEKQAPKVRKDRGRIEHEIASNVGWDRVYELSEEELNRVCAEWDAGRIPRAELVESLRSQVKPAGAS